jgi:hypothetical protein
MITPVLAKFGKTMGDLYAFADMEQCSAYNTNSENPRASKKHKPSSIASLAKKPTATFMEKTTHKERVQNSTKKDVIAELDSLGDSTYCQYWKKSELVERRFQTLIEQQNNTLACPSVVVSSTAAATTSTMKNVSLGKQPVSDSLHGGVVAEQQTQGNNPLPNQVKNAVSVTKESDNCFSVDVLPPPDPLHLTNEPQKFAVANDEQRFEALQDPVWTQGNRQDALKTFEPTLPAILSSSLKVELSPVATVVNPGHAELAKKIFIKPMPYITFKKPMTSTTSSATKTNRMRFGLYAHTGATINEIRKKALNPQPKSMILSKSGNNYELTDSDSESDSSEASRQRAILRAGKPIPEWARTKNLVPTLESQFSKECLIDPDELFGEFETCDLCAIFPNSTSEKRYKRRTSSGNWADHRLTDEEKARYKQQIGLMK